VTGKLLTRMDPGGLFTQLREELAVLERRTVAEVLRVFLEVSSRPCAARLQSLAFAFDDDSGRVAHLEARFDGPDPDALPGIEVDLTLPRLLPRGSGRIDSAMAAAYALTSTSLVARFERAIADLGAYRSIENVELVAVDVYEL
jgi:hypothetical protein